MAKRKKCMDFVISYQYDKEVKEKKYTLVLIIIDFV